MALNNPDNELRQKAEKLAAEGKSRKGKASSADKDVLLHDLEVHQIELKMQNEELRRAQQELQISRNLYADLFEFAPIGYFLLDRHLLIENANLTGRLMLDAGSRRLKRRRFMSFINPADQDALYGCFVSPGVDGENSHEVRMHRADGSKFFAELKIASESQQKENVKYRIAIVDITERKRMEDELRASRDELEVRVQERTEQLRQMTGQLTFAEQRERQRLSQILHDGLQQILVGAKYRLANVLRSQDIQQSTNQVIELIDDAIETSRSLTAELSPPVLFQGDLVSALEWLAGWMRDKQGLDTDLTVHRTIGRMPIEATLLLFQAVRELLFNVVKHSGVKTAYIQVDQRDGKISLSVEDRGSGFDTSRFNSKDNKLGGIGLLGIQERISYIGGRLEIDSAPGQGSRFKLSVPIAADKSRTGEKQARISAITAPELAAAKNKIRIMLVDDHMVMRQGLAGLLRSEPDLEISGEASDGEAAVKLVREIRPDMILMDISMPGMDGIQATSIIHKEHPEIPIIGLSMFQEGGQIAAMQEAGAVAYVTKSGPSQTLIDAIRTCVRRTGN
jgi:PAS domain S-box-containing protein